ncbi:hypothetical protein L7F22_061121 [Adiantum nelumboides]|nr:hypothetical protein [Adiantum nelumboides]
MQSKYEGCNHLETGDAMQHVDSLHSETILDACVKEVPNAIQRTLANVLGGLYSSQEAGSIANQLHLICQQLQKNLTFLSAMWVLCSNRWCVCMFQENVENLAALQQNYGLAKGVNEKFSKLIAKNLSAPLSAGCYFSSDPGLKSFEHPLQKLKPVFHVYSQKQALGVAFEVDMFRKEKDVMHRVGSEVNWA